MFLVMLGATVLARIIALLMPHGRRTDMANTKFGADEAKKASDAISEPTALDRSAPTALDRVGR